jgi:hypothetical protein
LTRAGGERIIRSGAQSPREEDIRRSANRIEELLPWNVVARMPELRIAV